MYLWIVFLHVLGAFGFLLAHGASFAVALRLRSERNPERVRALLDLSGGTLVVMYGSLLLLLATGIWAGFRGHWWGQGWIWAALGLLVVIALAMSILGSAYFNKVREAVGLPSLYDKKKLPLRQDTVDPDDLDALLRSWRPILVSIIGVTGLVAMLWLMVLKPF